MIRKFALCLLALIVLSTTVFAQPADMGLRSVIAVRQRLLMLTERAGRPNPVTTEIQLTNDQRLELAALREEIVIFAREQDQQRQQNVPTSKENESRFARTVENQLNSILDEGQRRRLSQLELQQDGAVALNRPEFATKLELTAAQRLRIRDAQRQFAFGAGRAAGPDYESFGHACYAILDDKQRAAWQDLIGPPSDAVRQRAPVVAGPVPEAKATPPTRFAVGPGSGRLEKPSVIQDLQLSDELVRQFADAHKEYNDAVAAVQGTHNAPLDRRQQVSQELKRSIQAFQNLCDTSLTDAQLARLRQLHFQSRGEQALLEEDFRHAAKLTDEQINSLDRLLTANKVDASAPLADQIQLRQKTLERGLKYLSSPQRKIWDQMTGPLLPLESLLDASEANAE